MSYPRECFSDPLCNEREEGEEKGKKKQGEAVRGPGEDPPAS